MSSIQALYPNGVFQWTDKIDQQNIVFAIDPNSIAAEVVAIENTLGTNPQIEPSPPMGTPITYQTVSQRITDAMTNRQMPVCSLTQQKITCSNVSNGILNFYKPDFDPHNMHNGTDITFPADGWWIVTATQTWDWWDRGFSHFRLCLNGLQNILSDHLINWEFPGNSIFGGIPGRWQLFGRRPLNSTVWWQGPAHKGDRISGVSENGTTNSNQNITNLSIKACLVSTFTGNFASG